MKEAAKLISIGDLFGESWRLYRERIGVLTKIMLLPVAFLLVGDLWVMFNPKSFFSVPFALVGTIVSFITALALIFALQENTQFSEAYRMAWKKIWSYGWLTILSGFVVLGGFVMLIIPGIIFSTWFVFAVYIFALHGEKGMDALLRSREYVRGYWWQVFGRQIVFGLPVLVAIMLLKFAGTALGGEAGALLVIDLFTLFFAPLVIAYIYTLYQNLKSLKPEVASQPPQGPRGFFYFSAVLGMLGLILFFIAIIAVGSGIFIAAPYNISVQ